jgi:hypothetical protein
LGNQVLDRMPTAKQTKAAGYRRGRHHKTTAAQKLDGGIAFKSEPDSFDNPFVPLVGLHGNFLRACARA